uniref:Uncharacterized protein n=1 Tax=Strongyloides venezuelensis TaxID=75913 RepID=A0A0K0FSC2_STRVS
MHFIKYFTILVLLAVQYSFQYDTTSYATMSGCTNCNNRGSDLGTRQGPPTDYVYRKKRSLKSAMGKAKNKAKKAGQKVSKGAEKIYDKTKSAVKKVVKGTKSAVRKLF